MMRWRKTGNKRLTKVLACMNLNESPDFNGPWKSAKCMGTAIKTSSYHKCDRWVLSERVTCTSFQIDHKSASARISLEKSNGRWRWDSLMHKRYFHYWLYSLCTMYTNVIHTVAWSTWDFHSYGTINVADWVFCQWDGWGINGGDGKKVINTNDGTIPGGDCWLLC